MWQVEASASGGQRTPTSHLLPTSRFGGQVGNAGLGEPHNHQYSRQQGQYGIGLHQGGQEDGPPALLGFLSRPVDGGGRDLSLIYGTPPEDYPHGDACKEDTHPYDGGYGYHPCNQPALHSDGYGADEAVEALGPWQGHKDQQPAEEFWLL